MSYEAKAKLLDGDQVMETPGPLPPFVIYFDGSVYSVRKLEGDDVAVPTLLLVPSRRVNELTEFRGAWDGNGVTCYAVTPAGLYWMLDEDYKYWVPAHHWDEAWRIADMLASLAKLRAA